MAVDCFVGFLFFRAAVGFLCNEGHTYSTIDDQHFKSTDTYNHPHCIATLVCAVYGFATLCILDLHQPDDAILVWVMQFTHFHIIHFKVGTTCLNNNIVYHLQLF